MTITEESRCSFVTEYFDVQANLMRQYMLLFYPADNSVEMIDMKNRRIFLKRVKYPQVSLKQLFIGSSVTIYSRVLKIVDFGDEVTRRHFSKNEEGLVIIHGEGVLSTGNIITALLDDEMRLINIRMVDPTPEIMKFGIDSRLIAVHIGGSNIPAKTERLTSKYVDVIVLTDPDDVVHAGEEIFSAPSTATLKNCAICLIKPHVIGSGLAGHIVQRIFDEGFMVTAMGSFNLSAADAEDFLEVYRGVVPEHSKLVEHISSAACWAMEVRAENVVEALRAVCGPHDPEVCHILFPHTIRSKFGVDLVHNGVHCTDLVEDGPLESEFFFQLMSQKAN
eukprot:Tbor_TRINITY_DN4163_c1_g2::TRINITY_DN4163_c1_g2_i1::g.26494::m.26494/K00940/ndk, NME; nucleoside-diphosphate kinase